MPQIDIGAFNHIATLTVVLVFVVYHLTLFFVLMKCCVVQAFTFFLETLKISVGVFKLSSQKFIINSLVLKVGAFRKL